MATTSRDFQHAEVFRRPPTEWEDALDALGYTYHDAWQLIWLETGRGAVPLSQELRRLLMRRLDHLHPEGAIALVPRLGEHAPAHATLPDFDADAEVLLDRLARSAPEVLEAARVGWPSPHRHAAALSLAALAGRPLPDDALRWFAHICLTLPDGDDHVWFDRVVRVAGDAAWRRARADGVATLRVANLAAAAEHLADLTMEARVAFARRHGRDAAGLVVEATEAGLIDLDAIEAGGSPPGGSALLYAAAVALAAAGRELPEALDDAVVEELWHPPAERAALLALFSAIPTDRARRLIAQHPGAEGSRTVLARLGDAALLERAARSVLEEPVEPGALPPSGALDELVRGGELGVRLAHVLLTEALPVWARLCLLDAIADAEVPAPGPVLAEALGDAAGTVRGRAAELLASLEDDALAWLGEPLCEARAEVRRAALEAFEGLDDSAARRAFAVALLDHAPHDEVRAALAEAAGLASGDAGTARRHTTEAERIAHLQRLATEGKGADKDALLDGLRDPSSAVREAVIDLIPAGAVGLLPGLEVLLEDPRQATREAAARAIGAIGVPRALDALERALGEERTAGVGGELRRAIVGCRGLPASAGAQGGGGWLATLPIPDLGGLELPEEVLALRWAEGERLKPDAVRGWLTLLSLEAPGRPCRAARDLWRALDAGDTAALGRALVEAWGRAGRPRHLAWARRQMAVSADEDWLYDVGRSLRDTYAVHQAPGEADMALLVEHRSPIGRLWLAHWRGRAEGMAGFAHALDEALRGSSDGPDAARLAEFAAEVELVAWPTLGFDACGQRVDEDEGGESRWTLAAAPGGRPGQVLEALEVVLTDLVIAPDAPNARHLHRRAALRREALQRQLNAVVADLAPRLHAAAAQGLRFTWPGWRRVFCDHPIVAALTRHVVFDDGACPVARARLEGRAEPPCPDAAVRMAPPCVHSSEVAGPAIEPETRRGRATLEPDGGPREVMTELRDLLYAPPGRESWERLCLLLNTWPPDTLDIALEYARGHLQAWDVPRHADLAWIASLLPANHRMRQSAVALGHRIHPRPDPRLTLCDTLTLLPALVTVDVAETLVRTPHLHQLTALHLIKGRIYGGAEPILARWAAFPALETLTLRAVRLRYAGFAELVDAAWMRRLGRLELNDCHLDDEHLALLLQSNATASLHTLRLRGNHLTARGLAQLAACPNLSRLRVLDLGENVRPHEHAALERELRSGLWLRQVSELRL